MPPPGPKPADHGTAVPPPAPPRNPPGPDSVGGATPNELWPFTLTVPAMTTAPCTSQMTGACDGWFLKVTVTPDGILTLLYLKTTAHFTGSYTAVAAWIIANTEVSVARWPSNQSVCREITFPAPPASA
jgi:hypothetical protein